MKKLFTYSRYLFAYGIWALYTFSTPVFAQSTSSSAVQDILKDERFKGALSSISWLTNQIDKYFTMAISLTAFFIISGALLKNVCAGAYVSNHKFWDKVAEAHEKTEALTLAGIGQYFSGKQFLNTQAGSLKDAVLGIIPNIKALTDFDDADIEPKTYFIKAIPQMLACVIIGVFIYNGYYRDTAAVVGDFGSEILNRVFSSVDPATFVDKITETTKTPDNIYANDSTLQGKDCYEISRTLYKVLLSNSTELSSESQKESLMRDAEHVAYTLTNNSKWQSTFYSESRKYDFSVSNLKITLVNKVPSGYSGSFDQPYVEKVDPKTDTKYAISTYGDIPDTARPYISPDYKHVYISAVVNGTTKDTSKKGVSGQTASAGTWNANSITKLSCYCSTVDAKPSNVSGVTTYESTSPYKYSDYVNTESLSTVVQAYCTEQELTFGSFVGKPSYSNYAAGSGEAPTFKFENAKIGDVVASAEVTVGFTATSSAGVEGTYQVKVPVEIILQ